MEPLDSFEARAWYAYQCLPRDEDGNPPASTQLESRVGLARGKLGKVFRDGAPKLTVDLLAKVALAVDASEDWLKAGIGKAPALTGMLPPRPGTFKPGRVAVVAYAIPNWDAAAAMAKQNKPKLAKEIDAIRNTIIPPEFVPTIATPTSVIRIVGLLHDARIKREELEAHQERVRPRGSEIPR